MLSRISSLPLLTFLLCGLFGCQSVPMPKGTVGDARTARFISPEKTAGKRIADAAHDSLPVIREAITSELTGAGITVTEGPADLAVNYLLILQDGATTRMVGDYYSSASSDILRAAHAAGDAAGSDDSYLPRGAILIDVIDPSTNGLVYRNYAAGPVMRDLPEAEREALIRKAVAQALADFLK